MRMWLGPLVLTVVATAYLAVAPTDDGSSSCADPPIVRVFSPEPEHDETHFFDAGTHCNAGARDRIGPLVAVVAVGSLVTVATARVPRRRSSTG